MVTDTFYLLIKTKKKKVIKLSGMQTNFKVCKWSADIKRLWEPLIYTTVVPPLTIFVSQWSTGPFARLPFNRRCDWVHGNFLTAKNKKNPHTVSWPYSTAIPPLPPSTVSWSGRYNDDGGFHVTLRNSSRYTTVVYLCYAQKSKTRYVLCAVCGVICS